MPHPPMKLNIVIIEHDTFQRSRAVKKNKNTFFQNEWNDIKMNVLKMMIWCLNAQTKMQFLTEKWAFD